MTIRESSAADHDPIVALSLRAWTPVFESVNDVTVNSWRRGVGLETEVATEDRDRPLLTRSGSLAVPLALRKGP